MGRIINHSYQLKHFIFVYLSDINPNTYTKMKYSLLLFISTILFACNKTEVKEEAPKNNNLVLAEDIQTILPIEKDTSFDWGKSDFTNAFAKFDEKALVSSITSAVLAGKIKAYSEYPDKELTLAQASKMLVSWDSTAMAEDPNHKGVMISAPMKFEISSWNVPQIRFHEKIELDTVTNELHKTTSHITLYILNHTETGEVIGIKKLFDVKFNN